MNPMQLLMGNNKNNIESEREDKKKKKPPYSVDKSHIFRALRQTYASSHGFDKISSSDDIPEHLHV